MVSFGKRHSAALVLLSGLTGAVIAQEQTPPAATTTTRTTQTTVETPDKTTTTTTTTREKVEMTGKRAGEIASQPARDIGAEKVKVPPAVEQAAAAPYALAGMRTCAQLSGAIADLNDALGPDYAGGVVVHENKVGKLAEAGGKTIVNTFIPFRGLVREISGAAPAERRLNAQIQAAFARRGFLRGIATARKCRLR